MSAERRKNWGREDDGTKDYGPGDGKGGAVGDESRDYEQGKGRWGGIYREEQWITWTAPNI